MLLPPPFHQSSWSPRKRVWALLVVVITLVAVEAGLRMLAKGLDDETIAAVRMQLRIYDPVLGWSNRPGASGTTRTAEMSYDVHVNRHGMRGPEIPLDKPLGVRRIAVLGDSFAWGQGVDQGDTFAALIDRDIADTQVLNFGVVGHGPVQHALRIEEVLRFNPDIVVIAFCLGNDFADNVFRRRYGFFKPFARLDDRGELQIAGYPVPKALVYPTVFDSHVLRWLQDHSHLFRLIEKAFLNARSFLVDEPQSGSSLAENQKDLYIRPDAAAVGQAVTINALLLESIVARFSARQIPAIVAAVPTRCELGGCFLEAPAPTDAARRALVRSMVNLPIPLIDPTPQFTWADFWLKDAHWRASGHRKMADAILPAVKAVLLAGRNQ